MLPVSCLSGGNLGIRVIGTDSTKKTKDYTITEARQATKTAKVEATESAGIAISETAAAIITQTQVAAVSTSLAATDTFSAEQTKQIVNITETYIAERKTLESVDEFLNQRSTEFDGTLPESWTIAREDPTRWDLNMKQSWLHIRGRYIYSYEDSWIAKNIFLNKIEYPNVTVITRVDGNMYLSGQSVWIGYTPDSFRTDGHSISLGIAMGGNGRYVFLTVCSSNFCESSSPQRSTYYTYYTYSASDILTFSGPVYLKLCQQGNKYSGYFSADGQTWIFLGEIEDFSPPGYFMLGAGGGVGYEKDEEFDGFFDFVIFETTK